MSSSLNPAAADHRGVEQSRPETDQIATAGPGIRIGEVAELCGLPAKTIRFYCDEQLIAPSAKTEGGYRLFDHQVINELKLIRVLKNLDMPLSQIKTLLEARRSGVCNCNHLKRSLALKIEAIDQKMTELKHMQSELNRLLDGWQNCGGTELNRPS